MALHPDRTREIFELAAAIPDADGRTIFLERECGADAALRRRIEELLGSSDVARSTNELNHTRTFDTQSCEPDVVVAEEHGAIIGGRYTLLRKIGEGGMGTVWVADQTHPVRRQVAIKLIKAGMDTSQVLARFAAERQALALMDHPNIARVLDGGTTGGPGDANVPGRLPYFVMELVNGVPITEFCDDGKLSVRERLELFIAVCHAVQHAHQKGIIHRDLKPSNILVERHDDRPTPKVIDFGLAKAMSGDSLTEHTFLTMPGQVAGTPLYMAPEQASGNALDIDTRADIYSLGAILYELLTGTTPLPRETLKNKPFDEWVRLVRECEAVKPSGRLSTLGTVSAVAASRQTEPAILGRVVRGDLDWVVMKALEKDRDRRYDTANGLAADVRRYLSNEPVLACPPSTWYRLRKFVRRNQGPVVAATLLVLALLGGIVGTSMGMLRAQSARAAEERQRGRAEIIAEFMRSTLEGAGPSVALGRDSQLLKDMMHSAVTRIDDGDLQSDPEAEAQLRQTIGNVYTQLGEFSTAESNYRRAAELAMEAHGANDARTNAIHLDLAKCLLQIGPIEDVQALANQVISACKARGEIESELYATALDVYGESEYQRSGGRLTEAEQAHRQALEIRRRMGAPGDVAISASLFEVATVLVAQGRYAEAEQLGWEALDICRNGRVSLHPETIHAICTQADILIDSMKFSEAEELLLPALTDAETVFGPEHPTVANVLWRIGNVYSGQRNHARAAPVHDRCLAIRRKIYRAPHKDIASAITSVARNKQRTGDAIGGELQFREALEMRRMLFSPDSPVIAASMNDLGQCLAELGRSEEACDLLSDSIRIWKATLPDSPVLSSTQSHLAVQLEKAGDFDAAIALFQEAVEALVKRHGPEHAAVSDAIASLGASLYRAGRIDEAEETLRKAVDVSRKANALLSTNAVGNLGYLLEARGDFTAAELLYREALALEQGQTHARNPDLAKILPLLGNNLQKQGRAAEAEPFLRESLDLRREYEPNTWRVHSASLTLGCALVTQKKYSEAEPLLLSGFEALKQNQTELSPAMRRQLLADAALSLATMYDDQEKPEEAAHWRNEAELLKE